jgi:hypothetical protein
MFALPANKCDLDIQRSKSMSHDQVRRRKETSVLGSDDHCRLLPSRPPLRAWNQHYALVINPLGGHSKDFTLLCSHRNPPLCSPALTMLAFISLIFFASTALAAIISSPRLSLGEGVVDNIMHRDAFVSYFGGFGPGPLLLIA